MDKELVYKGWVPLVGIPALFLAAFLLGYTPRLLDAPLCGVKLFIGIDCPGCGLTHAIVSLVHGHLRQSIGFNPLGVIIAAWLAYQFVRSCLRVIVHRPIGHVLSEGVRYRMLQVFIGVLLAQWAIKLMLILMA